MSYLLFPSDVVFNVDGVDFGAEWIPVLDFVLQIVSILSRLNAVEDHGTFEHTESTDQIHFRLRADRSVLITTNYSDAMASEPLAKLRLEFERFLSSVFDELATKYPALHDNVVIRELIREASRGNEQWEP